MTSWVLGTNRLANETSLRRNTQCQINRPAVVRTLTCGEAYRMREERTGNKDA